MTPITTQPNFVLSTQFIEELPGACAELMGDVPANLAESAMAEAFGEPSLAELRDSCSEQTSRAVDGRSFSAFLKERGYVIEVLTAHLVAAWAALQVVFKRHPTLHEHGSGLPEGNLDVLRLPPRERGDARRRLLAEGRTRLCDPEHLEEFLRAFCFVARLPKRRRNDHRKSYRLKHEAERQSFQLPDGALLKSDYISNGRMLAALLNDSADLAGPRRYRTQPDGLIV